MNTNKPIDAAQAASVKDGTTEGVREEKGTGELPYRKPRSNARQT